MLEHRVQLGASHDDTGAGGGNAEDSNGVSRGVENTDDEEQLKDMECSVQR